MDVLSLSHMVAYEPLTVVKGQGHFTWNLFMKGMSIIILHILSYVL